MAKDYWLKFGAGDPRTNTGLAPSFIIFQTIGGTALTAPAISEPGFSTGIYYFGYATSQSISFVVDGGSVLSSSDRYITGVLDPVQVVDQRIGVTQDSFGSTLTDPSTLFGYAKRHLEFNEGAAVFTKATGLWDVYSRGSSTLLMEKTLTNTTTAATKN